MKGSILLYIGFILWSTCQCHVTSKAETPSEVPVLTKLTNSVKKQLRDSLEMTTVSVIDNSEYKKVSGNDFITESQPRSDKGTSKSPVKGDFTRVPEIKNPKQKSSVNVYNPEKAVYLDDMMYSLKSQNWTEEEMPCLNATLHLLRSLQNFSLWAVWEWDSISSPPPQGLLFGNRYELGAFDECMNAPWAETHPELQTQYCLTNIKLERADGTPAVKRHMGASMNPYESAVNFLLRNKTNIQRPLNEMTWGGCLPASCGPRSVERLMATMLARSHLGLAGLRVNISVNQPCQRSDQPRKFNGLFWGFMGLFGALTAICLICTYINCNRKPGNMKIGEEVVASFCLKTNAMSLLNMKKENTEILYGIRFLTIAFIVLDHELVMFNSGPVLNGLQVDQEALSFRALFVLHDDLFVDTFFVLSGFLVASTIWKLRAKQFFRPTLFILKRYIRLVVCLAVAIFFQVAVFPYIGSGPLWNQAVENETAPCLRNWWINLLMVANYVKSDDMCFVTSWYIPCDFHFFVLTVLMFWLYKSLPRLALVLSALIAIASLIVPGVITYMYNLPATHMYTYDFAKNVRASEQFQMIYIKSHTRLSTYIIGLFAGFMFENFNRKNSKYISKTRAILGATAGLVIMIAVMMLGATYVWRSYSPVEGAIHAAIDRPLWAGGLVLFILSGCLGRVPLIEGFLSWYPWAPLSRLAYGLYLTHGILVTRYIMSLRNATYNDHVILLTEGLGVIVIACAAALVIFLLAEAPVNNLFTVYVKAQVTKKYSIEELKAAYEKGDLSTVKKKNNADTAPQAVVTISNLQKNLPSTIEVSSKM